MKKLLLILALASAQNIFSDTGIQQRKEEARQAFLQAHAEEQAEKAKDPEYVEQQDRKLKQDIADALNNTIKHINDEKSKAQFRYTKRLTAVFCALGLMSSLGSAIEGSDTFVETAGIAMKCAIIGVVGGLTIDGLRYTWTHS